MEPYRLALSSSVLCIHFPLCAKIKMYFIKYCGELVGKISRQCPPHPGFTLMMAVSFHWTPVIFHPAGWCQWSVSSFMGPALHEGHRSIYLVLWKLGFLLIIFRRKPYLEGSFRLVIRRLLQIVGPREPFRPSPQTCLDCPRRVVVPNFFGIRDWFCGRWFFHRSRRGWGWFRGDSSAFRLLAVKTDEASTSVHLLLCGPVPNSPRSRCWGPLTQRDQVRSTLEWKEEMGASSQALETDLLNRRADRLVGKQDETSQILPTFPTHLHFFLSLLRFPLHHFLFPSPSHITGLFSLPKPLASLLVAFLLSPSSWAIFCSAAAVLTPTVFPLRWKFAIHLLTIPPLPLLLWRYILYLVVK